MEPKAVGAIQFYEDRDNADKICHLLKNDTVAKQVVDDLYMFIDIIRQQEAYIASTQQQIEQRDGIISTLREIDAVKTGMISAYEQTILTMKVNVAFLAEDGDVRISNAERMVRELYDRFGNR